MFIIFIIFIILFLTLYYKESFNNYIKLDTVVIVEPRIHKNIKPIIKNIIEKLPNTPIQFFHGIKNKSFLQKTFSKEIKSKKIKLVNLNIKNLKIDDYNQLISSLDFWKKVKGNLILFMETDSCLCDNPTLNINEFLKYNYVGAPWKSNTDPNLINSVGNSGFSIRNKYQTIQFIKNNKYKYGLHSDGYFNKLKNKPTIQKAKKFSVESVFYPKPIGVHKPWKYLNNKQYNILKQNCKCLNQIDEY